MQRKAKGRCYAPARSVRVLKQHLYWTVQKTAKKHAYCKRGHVAAECGKKQREQQWPRDHALKTEESGSGSPRHNLQIISSSQRKEWQGPPASKRPRINIVRARVTTLYTHAPAPSSRRILDSAATSHVCWDRSCFVSLGHHEMLDTGGDPVETEGTGMVKLTLRVKFNQPLDLRAVDDTISALFFHIVNRHRQI